MSEMNKRRDELAEEYAEYEVNYEERDANLKDFKAGFDACLKELEAVWPDIERDWQTSAQKIEGALGEELHPPSIDWLHRQIFKRLEQG